MSHQPKITRDVATAFIAAHVHHTSQIRPRPKPKLKPWQTSAMGLGLAVVIWALAKIFS